MFALAIKGVAGVLPGGGAIHGNGDFTTPGLIQISGVKVGYGFFGKGKLFDDTFFHGKSPLIVILIFNALRLIINPFLELFKHFFIFCQHLYLLFSNRE